MAKIKGTTRGDTLRGTATKDEITGLAGDDILYGLAGDDILYGNEGNDTLHGGDDRDILLGHAGNDILYGGTGTDRLVGDVGDDVLYGGDGDDTWAYGVRNDFEGYLNGGAGHDTIYGEGGNDFLQGDSGADQLYGGTGADIFRFNGWTYSTLKSTGSKNPLFPSGVDTIHDFNSAEGDKLSFERWSGSEGGYNTPFTYSATRTGTGREYTVAWDGEKTVVEIFVDADAIADGTIYIVGNFTPDAGFDPVTYVYG